MVRETEHQKISRKRHRYSELYHYLNKAAHQALAVEHELRSAETYSREMVNLEAELHDLKSRLRSAKGYEKRDILNRITAKRTRYSRLSKGIHWARIGRLLKRMKDMLRDVSRAARLARR